MFYNSSKNNNKIWQNLISSKNVPNYFTELIDVEFDYFMKYLDNVLFNLKQSNLLKYFSLAIEVSRFINEILPGLYSLKETYDDFDGMKTKVDSIITTLIDYKDQVELYKNENQNRRHTMANMVIKRTYSD